MLLKQHPNPRTWLWIQDTITSWSSLSFFCRKRFQCSIPMSSTRSDSPFCCGKMISVTVKSFPIFLPIKKARVSMCLESSLDKLFMAWKRKVFTTLWGKKYFIVQLSWSPGLPSRSNAADTNLFGCPNICEDLLQSFLVQCYLSLLLCFLQIFHQRSSRSNWFKIKSHTYLNKKENTFQLGK